ncbi:MAG TPA: HEAT repeat domain-containing protein [Planctomycetota bacterium]|nr:HEAT repeat domain-containing protein [Planctomycetota bacterium]
MSAAERGSLYGTLKDTIDHLLLENGIHTLPLISKLLTDPVLPMDLRKAAVDAVSRIVHPQSVDFLLRLAASGRLDPEVQAMAIDGINNLMRNLHHVHETQPIMDLCKQVFNQAMNSPDERIRAAAVLGYGTVVRPEDDAAAAQFLRSLLKSDPSVDVRRIATNSLVGNRDWVEGNAWLSGEMRAVVASNAGEEDRSLALRVLVATRTPQAREAVLTCLQDNSQFMRSVAIYSAGELKMEEVTPALATVLANAEEDINLRLACLKALSEIPGTGSVRALLASAEGDVDPDIRGNALAAAEKAPGTADERLGKELVRFYETRTDPNEKDMAASILSQNASPEAYDTLRRVFISTAEDERLKVGSLLLASPHASDFAQSTFSELLGTRLGDTAVRVLFETAPDRALKEVEDFYVLGKGTGIDDGTRRTTIRSLGELGTARAESMLAKIRDIETDPSIQFEAESALRRIRDHQ